MPPTTTTPSEQDEKSKTSSRRQSSDAAQAVAEGDTAAKASNAPPFSPWHEIAFVFVICMAQFLSLAGLKQSIAPLDIIGRSFNITNPAALSWYPAAFSLTLGTFILPAGRLGDMFGHKTLYLAGFAWYGAASLLAGLAVYSGDTLFTAARALQGVGCALLVPNALALVGRAYGESPRKNMVFALFGAAAPTGATVGAVFASVLAQLAWWPWAYFGMTVACVAMIAAAAVVVPADEVQGSKFGDFDFAGCVTGVGGLVLFNFAWNQAAVVGWGTVYTYVLLIVGLLLLAAFAVVETRLAEHPLVPLRGFKGEAALALGVVAAGWGSFGIWVFYLWRLLESLRGYTPLAACAQNVPVAISGLTAALLTGVLLSHVQVSRVLLLATLCFLTGQILLATVPVQQIYWGQTFVSIVVMPWGMDLSFPSGTIILSNSTPKHDQGIAASLVNTVVNYSISLGLGIAGTIVSNIKRAGGSTLQQYRGAWYFGIGLDVVAVAIALYFVLKSR